MSSDGSDQLIAKYRGEFSAYEGFCACCKELLERLLQINGFRIHTVTFRTKSPESLAQKLKLRDRRYGTLEDVTDLCGVRVITYFADEVDKIAEMIEREFHVLPEHSSDRRKLLAPDRFGYLSVHFVCELRDTRLALAEYAEFRGRVCEIQVRSILQHAWAEIEHDLGYKVVEGIPRLLRRSFARLAGLFELADEEFMRIRDELGRYEAQVREDISETPSTILIDKVSLKAFLEQDPHSCELDQAIVMAVGVELEGTIEEDFLEHDVQLLRYVGLDTIESLRLAIEKRKTLIVEQFRRRWQEGHGRSLSHGIGVFHLFQVMLAEGGDVEAVRNGFDKFAIGGLADRDAREDAQELVQILQALKAQA